MTTNFNSRPDENQDPWYSSINSYFDSIEYEIKMRPRITRGTLPDGTDLNTLRGVEDAGTWRLDSTYTYINQPPERSSQTSSLTVDISNASVVQTISSYNRIDYRQAPAGVFGTWRRFMTNSDVGQVMLHPSLTISSNLDTLPDGWYPIWYVQTALALGLPGRIGILKVETIIDSPTGNPIRIQKYETNQGSITEGYYHPYEVWVRGMTVDRAYEDTFTRVVPPAETKIPVYESGPTNADRISSEGGEGNYVFQKNPDSVAITKSTMKLMTLLGLRRIVGNGISELVEVKTTDTNPGGSGGITYQVGDLVSFEDLAYGMMLPSSNWSSNIIARAAGEKLPGAGDGYEKFMDYVQGIADDEGWTGAVIADASGLSNSNRLSTNMLNKLCYLHKSDSWAKNLTTTSTHTMNIQGPNARQIDIDHGFDLESFPELVLVKTGSGAGYFNAAALWETRTGVLCSTSIISNNSAQRNLDLRYVIDLTKRTFDQQYLV